MEVKRHLLNESNVSEKELKARSFPPRLSHFKCWRPTDVTFKIWSHIFGLLLNGYLLLHILNHLSGHNDVSHSHFFYLWFAACVSDALVNIFISLNITLNGFLFLTDFKSEFQYATKSMEKLVQIILILYIYKLADSAFLVIATCTEMINLMMKMFYHDQAIINKYKRTYKYQPRKHWLVELLDIYPRFGANIALLIISIISMFIGTCQDPKKIVGFFIATIFQTILQLYNSTNDQSLETISISLNFVINYLLISTRLQQL